MVEQAELRSRIYAVLSVAFSPPGRGLGLPGGVQTAVRTFAEAARALSVPVPEDARVALEESGRRANLDLAHHGGDELEAEYNRLFVGPEAPRVYPYESMYRDSTGLVMGPPAGEVFQAYRRNGLAINAAYRDLPDHIAVEFEFMARLCGAEARAESMGRAELACRLREEQRSFLAAHLAVWLPALCERVIRETCSPMYRDLAKIAATFVGWDRETLDEEGRVPMEVRA